MVVAVQCVTLVLCTIFQSCISRRHLMLLSQRARSVQKGNIPASTYIFHFQYQPSNSSKICFKFVFRLFIKRYLLQEVMLLCSSEIL